jgi:hypothetical protein
MALARIPSPPAFEQTATNSGVVMFIMVPAKIGYLIPSISVTVVFNIGLSIRDSA